MNQDMYVKIIYQPT